MSPRSRKKSPRLKMNRITRLHQPSSSIFGRTNHELFSPEELEDVAGWGIKATINGEKSIIGKAELSENQKPNNLKKAIGTGLAKEGKTVVFARDSIGIVAIIALKDVIRTETKTALAELKRLGIKTTMLTGDK